MKVLIFFVLALVLPVVNNLIGGTISSNKLLSVALLAVFQQLRIAVHPLLPAPGTSLGTHLTAFVPITCSVLAISFGLNLAGFPIGYPALGSLQAAFVVPYTIFVGYLLLFTSLITNGYSRQWANLVLVITLMTIDTAPFHLNPIISCVSFIFRGPSVIYAIHVAAIATAVFTVRVVEHLKTAARKTQ